MARPLAPSHATPNKKGLDSTCCQAQYRVVNQTHGNCSVGIALSGTQVIANSRYLSSRADIPSCCSANHAS